MVIHSRGMRWFRGGMSKKEVEGDDDLEVVDSREHEV